MSNPFVHLTVGKTIAMGVGIMLAILLLTSNGVMREEEELRVAMIGNSLMYYNDLPRLLEAMSGGKLFQDSCLHGMATFQSHLLYGNGMYAKWNTGNARIWNFYNADYEAAAAAYQEYMEGVYSDSNNNDNNDNNYNGDDDSQQQYNYQLDTKYSHIYDFGACTARQLLLGVDDRLVENYENDNDNNHNDNDRRHQRQLQRQRQRQRRIQNGTKQRTIQKFQKKEKIIVSEAEGGNHRLEDAANDYDDDYYSMDDNAPVDDDKQEVNYYTNVDDDSFNDNYPLTNDGKNPCLLGANYYFFKQSQYDEFNGGIPKWDYLLLNDNSRGPCCTSPREESLEVLVDTYVPWILKTGAVPVFMVTHAYWPSTRDMSGLVDIPTFLSLTYEGYRQYAKTIGQLLPEHQQPKIAPVGLAFLLIWEESPSFWETLIHMDEIHLTPSGTYLEGLIVYATLYGHLPSPNVVLNADIANLFGNARRMVPTDHIREAYPTLDNARYMYRIASRIMNGEIPLSFRHYTNGESVNFTASKISSNSNNNNNR